MVVIVDCHGDALVQLGQVFEPAGCSQLILQCFIESFLETVLPGATFVLAGQQDFQFFTQISQPVAQILTALVTV